MTAGIDVSRWQGLVDWRQVAAAGIRFAYVNASNQIPDLQFHGARNAGLAVGLYFRLPPTMAPAVGADMFAAHVNRLGAAGRGPLPPCLDLEDGDGDQSGRAAEFVAHLRAQTGTRRVVVYSGAWFFANRIREHWMDPDIALWIADWSAPPGRPSYLTPRVAIHQHSSTGTIPGVSGPVDLDHMIWPLQRLTGEAPMDIISRAEWGAGYDNGFRPAPLPAQEVWLHHSVTVAPDLVPPFDDDHAAIRTLERIGEQRFGRGISYTFPITPAGLIFEGHSVDRVGAHTGGRNTVSRAICFVGDYERNRPTEAMLDAAAWLLREGRARGWWTAARLTGGHRDAPGASTACPGRHAYALISEINRRAASGGPVPPPPPPKGFEDLMAEIRIHLNSDGTFRGTAKAEAGGGSAVGGDSYVALGSTWGYTDFTTTALGPDGTVLFQWPNVRVHNNLHWAQKLPNGTRTVTVEGRVEHDPSANPSPTIPAAAVWTKPL